MATLPPTDFEVIRAAVQSVVLDVLRRRAAGESLPDEQVIASRPELAEHLHVELAKLQQICAAENDAEHKSDVLLATADMRAVRTPSMLQIQCPHCREPFETATDTPVTEIVCSTCGGQFSLAGDDRETRFAPSLKSLAHFDLVERLGVGGFGTVWKARDRKLDRTVAVKIPRHGMLNDDDLEKFLREARAAAQLQHPYIVRVYEVGRDGDSVYIVSDFVRGIPLNEWLTGQQPTMRQAAEICIAIAEALQHAHDRGVIHRDLKPANILIDGEGRPHLMDFGLARREVGEVTVTLDGQVLGTPAYMSPEQAQGEAHTADARSDIYSLGVIFFQLLTGELPFRGSARMIMHQVIHDDPPSPRKLNSAVPRDLETICLKCMRKEPSKRYQSSRELIDELKRYLHGEPILTRPLGVAERTLRWAKRRPALAGMIAVSALSMVALLAGSAWYSARLRDANRSLERERDNVVAAERRTADSLSRTLAAEADAKRQRDDALAQQQRADEQAAVAQAINQFLVVDLLTQAEPGHNAPVDRVPLLVVLDRAADKVGERFQNQPLLEASLRGTLGDVYHGLGAYDKAERHWSAALALRRGVLGEDDLETYRAMSKLGHVLMHLRRLEESAGLLRTAAAGLTRVLGADHPDTLYANASLAYTYLNMRRFDEAISLCEQTLGRQKATPDSDDFVTLNWLMDCLANAYQGAGRMDKALPQAEQALEKTKAALGPDHPRTLISISTLADLYWAANQRDKALSLYEQWLEKTKAKFDPDHPNTLYAQWRLGVAYYTARQLNRSIPLFEEILRVRRAKFGENDPETIWTALNLAVNYRAAKRLDEAIALSEEWLARSRQTLGVDHQHTLFGLSDLAATYVQANEFDRAVPLYRELLDIQSRKLPADHPDRANTLASLGQCLLSAGKTTDAEPVLRECLAIRERKEPDAWTTFHTKSMLGGTLAGQKKYADAEPLLLQGYEGLKRREAKIPASSKVILAEALERLVQHYDALDKKDEAAKWRKELEADEK